MGTTSEIFLASENGGGGGGGRECDFGLGLRMNQRKDSSSSSLPRNQQPGGYGGAGAGPFFWNSSYQVTCRNDVVGGAGSGSGAIAVPMSLHHPFSPSTLPFTVSGMAAAVSCVAPFTVAQWEELQRQSVIYKYMESSVPVPPELLVPFSKPSTASLAVTPSPRSNMGRGSVELGFSSNKDPEPWRCRRTDGKKWRCTRDVAPDQKYCERHTHKGRHRSRKPVELHADFISNYTRNTSKPYQKPCSVFFNQSQREREDQLCSFPSSAVAESYDQSRCLDWFIHGETIPVSSHNANQEWLNMMMQPIPKVGLMLDDEKLCFLHHQHDDSLSLRSYTGFGHGDDHDRCNLLLGREGGLIPNQTQQTRLFINTWSAAERDDIARHKSSVYSNGKLPFSCLTLSMSGGDEENETAQMGLSANWMSPVSWMNSPPGGPLGEALCLGIASSASSSTTCTSKSSYGDGGHQGRNFIN